MNIKERYLPGITGFYCHDVGHYVICSAPLQCFSKCREYKARAVTGVRKRNGKMQGYYEGIYLVDVA